MDKSETVEKTACFEIPAKLQLKAKGLNAFFGGGIESGIVTNAYGPAGSGKTSLALEAAISCIEAGKKVAFIDTEGGFSVERFMQMTSKKNLENIIIFEPKDFKEQSKIISSLDALCKSKDIGLVVVDSFVALYRLEKNSEDIADINRELSSQLAALSRIARERKMPVLITNQVYSDFETGELELVGRDIPKYGSKCLVSLEKIGDSKRKITMIKHRSIAEGTSAAIEIKNEGLVDMEKRFKIF